MKLHKFLDVNYGADGDDVLRRMLDAGSDLHYPDDPDGDAYVKRLLAVASLQVAEILRSAR